MALAPPPPNAIPKPIDRDSTVPFHIKIFYRQNGFPRLDEFSTSSASLPAHLSLYTWPSCTLRELSYLVVSHLQVLQPSSLPEPAIGTRLSYRLLYPDTRDAFVRPSAPGRYLSKELGSVVVRAEAEAEAGTGTNGASLRGETKEEEIVDDADRTLQDARFVVGDYITAAIIPPLANGAILPPLAPGSMGGDVSIRGGRGGLASGPGRGGFSSARGGAPSGPREIGFGGFRVRGRGGLTGVGMGERIPEGEWRRGERLPEVETSGRGGRGRFNEGRQERRW